MREFFFLFKSLLARYTHYVSLPTSQGREDEDTLLSAVPILFLSSVLAFADQPIKSTKGAESFLTAEISVCHFLGEFTTKISNCPYWGTLVSQISSIKQSIFPQSRVFPTLIPGEWRQRFMKRLLFMVVVLMPMLVSLSLFCLGRFAS